ncbi:tetraspanin-33-like [Clarias magur]|uniref:Tetraspanin n=1 Tax=Clarias magur TaxID=1594786 RepID=A0A8J4XDP5_CLAMG|nr:tetraspanin-33-like [Clarias magur]
MDSSIICKTCVIHAVRSIQFSFSLTLVFLAQLIIAILSFIYSDQTRDALGKFVKKAIVHYRDDLDLQNLMDYIQQEASELTACVCINNLPASNDYGLTLKFRCCGWNNYTDWSWNMHFNCTQRNPSNERCAVPFSCCTRAPTETVNTTICFGVQAQKHLKAAESIYTDGCADRAATWIESHLILVGTLVLGLALPQIAGIMLSQMLVSQIENKMNS